VRAGWGLSLADDTLGIDVHEFVSAEVVGLTGRLQRKFRYTFLVAVVPDAAPSVCDVLGGRGVFALQQ
jgi:hypothetical protein